MPDSSIVLMGGDTFEGYKNDVWRSADSGVTWTLMNASAGWSAREGAYQCRPVRRQHRFDGADIIRTMSGVR